MSKYKVCRGFRDLLPLEFKKYDFLGDNIREISDVYGYKMMDTACLEDSRLFSECYHDDELENKMFNVEGRFVNVASLNYDSSVSILRSVVENKLYVDKSLPLRFMYMKNEYYYDKKDTSKASKCVFGFECVSDKSVYLDVENVLLSLRILSYLGISSYNLRINNVGEDSDCYKKFKDSLDELVISYEEDKKVRGSCSTGIAYEIDVDRFNGVIRGDRHDSLVEIIGGVKVCACGMKIDLDELVRVMDMLELFPSFAEEIDFYIIPKGEKTFNYALYVSEKLRELGAIVDIHYKEYDLKRLDSLLDRVDVIYSLIIDEEDVKKKTVKVFNGFSKEEKSVYLKDLLKGLETLDEHHHKEG